MLPPAPNPPPAGTPPVNAPGSSSPLVPAVLGLLSAVLTLASVTIPTIGVLTLPVAAAPLFYAGLTRNVRGAGIACGVALLGALLFAGIGGFLLLALISAGPAMIVAWYANLSRPVDEDDPASPVEWFPLSEIMARLAIYVTLVVLGIVVATGYDPATLSDQLGAAMRTIFVEAGRQNPELTLPSDERIAEQTALFARFVPGLLPAGLLLVLFTSLAVASLIARARGSQRRERDDVPAEAGLPVAALAVFAVAVACLALGLLPVAAMAITGALGFLFALIGLAVIHYLVRGRPTRSIMLVLLYIALLLIPWLWFPLLLLGLAETLLGLRARFLNRTTTT